MSKILQYYTLAIPGSANLRSIRIYSEGKLFAELECLPGLLSDGEEIQNYLDDNGHGDEAFDFVLVSPIDILIQQYQSFWKLAKQKEEKAKANLKLKSNREELIKVRAEKTLYADFINQLTGLKNISGQVG